MWHSVKLVAMGCLFGASIGFVLGSENGMRLERFTRNFVIRSNGNLSIDGDELPKVSVCHLGCKTDADVACSEFRHLLNAGDRGYNHFKHPE